MNMFVKPFICTALTAALVLPAEALVVTASIADKTFPENTVVVTTNRASVYNIQLTATANSIVNFYDNDVTNAPSYGSNFVNASYVSRSTYATNLVTSFVGYNGYTNWYTNVGVFTLTTTNAAATNVMSPILSIAVTANTLSSVDVDALFVRGIVAIAGLGTNINMVINYRSGQ